MSCHESCNLDNGYRVVPARGVPEGPHGRRTQTISAHNALLASSPCTHRLAERIGPSTQVGARTQRLAGVAQIGLASSAMVRTSSRCPSFRLNWNHSSGLEAYRVTRPSVPRSRSFSTPQATTWWEPYQPNCLLWTRSPKASCFNTITK